MAVFHRDNLAQQESGVQRVHRDKEERLVTWAELDQLAKGLISYFHLQHINQKVIHISTCSSVCRIHVLIGEYLCLKGPTGTDGGPGTKGPVVCKDI